MGEPLDEAARHRGLDVARRGGFDDVCFCLRLADLERAAITGDPGAGEILLGELADMVQRMGRPRLLESRLFLLAPLYFLQRGEVARQAGPIDKLESFLEVMDDWFVRLHVLMYRALVAAGAGDRDVAEQLTDAAIAAARERHFNRLDLLSCTRAELHAARGEREAARRLAGGALDRARSAAFANPFDEALALRVLGEATGGADGIGLLRESLAVARTRANSLHAGRALLALGRALAPAEGRAALVEARGAFEQLRADAWLAEVDRALQH